MRRYQRRQAALVRLVCFPHAGGGAGAFRAWDALLPPTVELVVVQYLGREDRFSDPLVGNMPDLVAAKLDPALTRTAASWPSTP